TGGNAFPVDPSPDGVPTTRKEPEPALAAPGLTGPFSIEQPSPLSGPRANRRARNRSYSHVHLEVDLDPKPKDPEGVPVLERLAGAVSERKIVEKGTLLVLAAATLHALSSRQFRRVDHWEVTPGGWLPPPSKGTDAVGREPVGDLLAALEGGAWDAVAKARAFSARLSDLQGNHVDVTVRRVHREHRHAMSLDLWGSWTKAKLTELEGSVAERLPVVRSTMTKFQYA
ncbi:MAG: hypothetical protein L3J81_05305, partial [Thermoplasmata archaeon]|nr:hypothetical protein [Thermoplasmata archaeon]